MKKAIVFGATGFIGTHLVEELLKSPDYEQVTVVVRKNINLTHSKLKILKGDLNSLPSLKDQIKADEVFIALGTTKKHTPDRVDYYKIDHDYPVLAAMLAKEGGAKSVFLVSAVGANANSNVFYVKTKGETERDVIALNLDQTHIFRPSMIVGHRQEERAFEKFLIKVWNVIDPIFAGPLDIYRGSDGKDIAKTMVRAAQSTSGKIKIYHWKEMRALLV